jgi:fatty acid desaturase
MHVHLPHGYDRVSARSQPLRELFWVLALGVLLVFAFFVVLGAIKPGAVIGLTVGVCVLAALWVLHAWIQSRHAADARDERLVHARERRGF